MLNPKDTCLVLLMSNYDMSPSHFLTISIVVIKLLAMWRVDRVIFSRIVTLIFLLVDFFCFAFKPVSFLSDCGVVLYFHKHVDGKGNSSREKSYKL